MRPVTEKYSSKKNSKQNSLVFDFFFTLGEALSAGNLDIIKKYWAIPSYILSDRLTALMSSSEDLEKYYSAKKKEYTKRTISTARSEILRVQWMTDQIIVVHVKWSLLDKSAKEIGEESALYTLKSDQNAKLKIHTMAALREKTVEVFAH